MSRWRVVLGCSLGAATLFGAVIVGSGLVRRTPTDAATALLRQADTLSWNNQWIEAQPLYLAAEIRFKQENRQAEALYAHVSQYIPRAESEPMAPLLQDLQNSLETPYGHVTATKIRILTIEGMIATNYDASMARSVWKQVEEMASQHQEYRLMMRAQGEQGIAAFLLGDLANAKRLVAHAWFAAKYFGDPAAHVRYASVYGAGLVELQRYDEAIRALNEAIRTAEGSAGVAYPSIAINSKIDALRGLHRYQEALALATEALQHLPSNQLDAHLFQIYKAKGRTFEDMGQSQEAIRQYQIALTYARHLEYWRGIMEAGALVARAREHQGQFDLALTSIDETIAAESHRPGEIYFLPGHLAIKAEILEAQHHQKASRKLYERSTRLVDALLATAPTPNVERQLIAQLEGVYTGYYKALWDDKNFAAAFDVIERARGRVEAEALTDHRIASARALTPQEKTISSLNLELLRTVDVTARSQIDEVLYDTENQLDQSPIRANPFQKPVALDSVASYLGKNEVILEYVLDDQESSVMAITAEHVRRYLLPSRRTIELQAATYRRSIVRKNVDPQLGQILYDELLGVVPEYRQKSGVIVIPDDDLHLLPFSALQDHGRFTLVDHSFSVAASTTVLCLLRARERPERPAGRQYLGVAAWTNKDQEEVPPMNRMSAPPPDLFRALPHSEEEVDSIAKQFPNSNMLLLGSDATETRFKHLPLERYRILHFALHAYADSEFPDRSALVFAPEPSGPDDGLLEAREVRQLRLGASLVTLSGCNTGVGPVGESDVASLANAFIEAGAESVVSSLWALDDNTTSRLMTAFYSGLRQNVTKTEALRQAQLSLQREGLPPYYWASFQLVGDPSGII
jgi:CHAT domain-containing protein